MKRVYQWIPGSSAYAVSVQRSILLFNADHLCNGYQGREEGETIYEWVTEHRQSQNTIARRSNKNILAYQSCGDLIHSSLFLGGCRDEYLINRTGDNGKIPWITGVNISRISRNPAFKVFTQGDVDLAESLPGDVFILLGEQQGTEHACMFNKMNLASKIVSSYDYGQFNKSSGKYSGHAVDRTLEFKNGKAWLISSSGVRKYIYGKLDISKITFSESAIVPNNFPYGVLDDNPYYDENEKVENFFMLDELFGICGITNK